MLLVGLQVKQALVITLKGNSREEDRARAKALFTAALDQLKLLQDARRWHRLGGDCTEQAFRHTRILRAAPGDSIVTGGHRYRRPAMPG